MIQYIFIKVIYINLGRLFSRIFTQCLSKCFGIVPHSPVNCPSCDGRHSVIMNFGSSHYRDNSSGHLSPARIFCAVHKKMCFVRKLKPENPRRRANSYKHSHKYILYLPYLIESSGSMHRKAWPCRFV